MVAIIDMQIGQLFSWPIIQKFWKSVYIYIIKSEKISISSGRYLIVSNVKNMSAVHHS